MRESRRCTTSMAHINEEEACQYTQNLEKIMAMSWAPILKNEEPDAMKQAIQTYKEAMAGHNTRDGGG